MVSAGTLLLFYRRHLRVQPLRELMAVVGVAAGVALLFAVQIANNSVTGSFKQVIHGVAGRATLEVAARSPEGFAENTNEAVENTPGVRATAPVLTQEVVLVGTRSSQALTLVGADERLAALGGNLVTGFQHYAEASRGFLVVTQPTAQAIGAKPGHPVTIRLDGRSEHLTLGAVVPTSKLGALAESPIAASLLPVVQVIAGLHNRITRILVEPTPGRESAVREALIRRFGTTLNVRSVNAEGGLLSDAAKPEGQLTALFSAISLVVGMILAYNALLLASGERRAFVAHLIQLGTPDGTIVASLLFDALILGIVGSLLGLLAGDAISLFAYRAPPGYLTAAFPLGGQRIVTSQTILIAFGAGIVSAFAAAALPSIALLRSSAIHDPQITSRALSMLRRPRFSDTATFIVGGLLIGASIAASMLWTATTVIALVTLAAGIVLCLPMIVRYTLRLAHSASRRTNDPSARLASGELRTSPTRSIALVATGTIAVFLMMMIGGAVADVQRAVRLGAKQTGAGADFWIKPGGSENVYGTQPFAFADTQRRLLHLGIVASVLAYRQSFLDLPDRRLWVIGVPSQAHEPIAKSQLVSGSFAVAAQRLREGGWAVISQTIASQRHLRLGESFELPTPAGQSTFRLAATISNYGWLPGTVLLSADEYARLWRTSRASQLAVTLKPGVPLGQGQVALQSALPKGSALTVQTAEDRQSQVAAVLGSTLSRLDQTSGIVLVAAIATVIAMMISAIWQRRGRLDALISIGMSFTQLARLVFYESGCVLLGGCLVGFVSGSFSQYLVDRWTQQSSGSPVRFAVAWQLGLRTIVIAGLISMTAAAIAVFRSEGIQPKAAFSID